MLSAIFSLLFLSIVCEEISISSTVVAVESKRGTTSIKYNPDILLSCIRKKKSPFLNGNDGSGDHDDDDDDDDDDDQAQIFWSGKRGKGESLKTHWYQHQCNNAIFHLRCKKEGAKKNDNRFPLASIAMMTSVVDPLSPPLATLTCNNNNIIHYRNRKNDTNHDNNNSSSSSSSNSSRIKTLQQIRKHLSTCCICCENATAASTRIMAAARATKKLSRTYTRDTWNDVLPTANKNNI